jgi:hypothetical protein
MIIKTPTPAQQLEASRSRMACSPAQIRLALLNAGKLAEVETLVAASPSAQIVWEYATTIYRNSPLIDALRGDAFTPEEIDALFIAAMQVEL